MRTLFRKLFLQLFGSLAKPKPGIHIINGHFVAPNVPSLLDKNIYESFILYLLDMGCTLIPFNEATEQIYKKKILRKKCMVAFSYDDGFEECYTTIAPLLEKYNCNAAFFINANYIESNEIYQTNFRQRINTFTKKPMTWEQVKELHQRGHIIGSHTLDHVNMAELNIKEMDFQLKENKYLLEKKLNYNCDYFAWPYGQLHHFPKTALEQTQKYHKYIFSATNYQHYFSLNEQVINRRHIEAFWPKSHIKYFLSVQKK